MFRAQVQSAILNVETALFERIATFIEIVKILYPCIISMMFKPHPMFFVFLLGLKHFQVLTNLVVFRTPIPRETVVI